MDLKYWNKLKDGKRKKNKFTVSEYHDQNIVPYHVRDRYVALEQVYRYYIIIIVFECQISRKVTIVFSFSGAQLGFFEGRG